MADITFLTVRNQLNAMACSLYEVGILDRVLGNMITRTFKKSDVLNSINWFKHLNTENKEIFIRPHGSIGLIFFDDLSAKTIEQMKVDGYEPAISLESSPQNYQGWIRVSNHEISNDLATQCSKVIVNKYQADCNSADFRHFGRLAGFTNNKPKYVDQFGRYPFVKLSARNGKLATNFQEILAKGNELLLKKEEKATIDKDQYLQVNDNSNEALVICTNQYNNIIERYTNDPNFEVNLNAVDWQVAKYLANNGFTYDVILSCLLAVSPNLDQRKGRGRGTNYIERTLNKLFTI